MNIAILLFFSFIMRFVGLTQSLWLDEGTTARVSTLTYLEIITKYAPSDFHPPLYYVLMKTWVMIFGTSEIALRMPSIIFALIAGYMVYRIAWYLKNQTYGLYAAALFLCNPLIMYYSQEARMYLMVTAFLTIALFSYIRLVREKRPLLRDYVLMNIFSGLSLITFYGSVFFLVPLYLFLLFRRRFRLLSRLLPGVILAVFAVAPLLVVQLEHSKDALALIPHWSLVLGKANVKDVLLVFVKFVTGRISFEPKILYFGLAAISSVYVYYLACRSGKRNKMLYSFFLLPIVLGLLVSFFMPLMQYFRFIYLIPVLCVLLVLGLTRIRYIVVVLFIFLLWSFAYLVNPAFHREDWKTLAQRIPKNAKVVGIPSSLDAFKYYSKDADIIDIRVRDIQGPVYVIPYTFDIYGVNAYAILSSQLLHRTAQFTVRGIAYEKWE